MIMSLRKATINDIPELQKICNTIYTEVFADHWLEDGLELYLNEQFSSDKLKREMRSEMYDYHFIRLKGINIGFTKVNYNDNESLTDLDNCELEKIYISLKYIGAGMGKSSMLELFQLARAKGKSKMFVCVLDTNFAALAFYRKIGFQNHSILRLQAPKFKDDLRGMIRMEIDLKQGLRNL